ncbi:hypothetical protein SR1949_12220 [Sphaerospermopsis reniformis]|jgi:hypothetical protein|uniref:Uncharacterized protein n=1 Tax=Sphaerospermopsis reniformis TaxID=531300 RepID=A0A479ZV97_9CYAN|nr:MULTISPECIES: hypothetical protein [Sphaerospermopsis]GCL36122.1 hypothetical protein SR1949_12220 [Sphaerospermopsis reniformis]
MFVDIHGILSYESRRQEAAVKVQSLALRVVADKLAHDKVQYDLYSITL